MTADVKKPGGDKPRRARRFYKQAGTGPGERGERVLLDGRPVRTPMKQVLEVPGAALAEAIAGEWEAQKEEIDPSAMPLTAFACTAIDRAGLQREDLEKQLLAYGANDLLCYWAERPDRLVERQRQHWQALLDWCEERHGARLAVAAGILHQPQPEEGQKALKAAVEAMDVFRLAALSVTVAATGSLVIGLALVDGHINSEKAFENAELDATFQIEHWGEDYEASRRRATLRRDLEDVERFLELLK